MQYGTAKSKIMHSLKLQASDGSARRNIRKLQHLIAIFSADCGGSALIEYSLIAGGVGLGVMTAILSLGAEVTALYQLIVTGIQSIH